MGLRYTLCLFLDNELRSVFVLSPLLVYRLVFGKDSLIPDICLEAKLQLQLPQYFFPSIMPHNSKALRLPFSTQRHTEQETACVVVAAVNVHIITLKRPAWR